MLIVAQRTLRLAYSNSASYFGDIIMGGGQRKDKLDPDLSSNQLGEDESPSWASPPVQQTVYQHISLNTHLDFIRTWSNSQQVGCFCLWCCLYREEQALTRAGATQQLVCHLYTCVLLGHLLHTKSYHQLPEKRGGQWETSLSLVVIASHESCTLCYSVFCRYWNDIQRKDLVKRTLCSSLPFTRHYGKGNTELLSLYYENSVY